MKNRVWGIDDFVCCVGIGWKRMDSIIVLLELVLTDSGEGKLFRGYWSSRVG